jgi:hypothetical protein
MIPAVCTSALLLTSAAHAKKLLVVLVGVVSAALLVIHVGAIKRQQLHPPCFLVCALLLYCC